jgi:hypothetical protein
MQTGDGHTCSWCRDLKEGAHLEHLGVDRITLKWIFKKYDGEA